MYSNISQILLLYKTWGYYNEFDSAKPWGYVTDVPKYHNAGIWSKDQTILRFMFKTYSSSNSLVITSRWFATSRLASPASVKLVYYLMWRYKWILNWYVGAYIYIRRYDIKARRLLACDLNGITQLGDWCMDTYNHSPWRARDYMYLSTNLHRCVMPFKSQAHAFSL